MAEPDPPDLLDFTGRFNTALRPDQERAFQAWAQKAGRSGDVRDYDLRGAWKSGASAADNGHFPDTFKKPNHPTFSTESQYSTDGAPGGEWAQGDGGRWSFRPSPINLGLHSAPGLQQYFQEREPDADLLIAPEGGGYAPGGEVASPASLTPVDYDPFADAPAPAAAPAAAPSAGAGKLTPVDYDPFAGTPTNEPLPTGMSGLVKTVGNAVGSATDWIGNAITGNDRRVAGITELPSNYTMPTIAAGAESGTPGEEHGDLNALMGLAQSDEGKLDIFRKRFPNAPVTKDPYGNPLVTMPDSKQYYLNRPGLSGQDVDDTMTQVAAAMPFARAAKIIGGLGLLGRAAGAGLASGAGSLTQDVASNVAGSEQLPSLGQAATNATFGAGAELLSPAATALYQSFKRAPRMMDPATGLLTAEGQAAVKAAGLDPDRLGPQFAETFEREAKSAANPGDAARAAQASSLPVEVPLTKGDLSRTPGDQMTESLMEKGAYGDPAFRAMAGARDAQQQALYANAEAIRSDIAGGAPAATAGQGVTAAQSKLLENRDALNSLVNQAYDSARSSTAAIPNRTAQQFTYGMQKALADFPPEVAPQTNKLMEGFSNLIGGPDNRQVLVNALELKRRQLSNLTVGLTPDAAAARSAVKAYDKGIDAMVAQDLFQGDRGAIQAWKDARSLRRDLGKRFQGDDLIEALTEKAPRGGTTQLAVAPEEAANYIFGRSQLNLGKANLARDLKRMRQELGGTPVDDGLSIPDGAPRSSEWDAIREEAFLRLVRAAEGPYNRELTQRSFSGDKFATAIDRAMTQSPEVMTTLFSPTELSTIQQLKDVGLRATNKVRGGDNYSNTAVAASNMAQKLGTRLRGMPWIGERAAAIIGGMPGLNMAFRTTQGIRALSRANATPERAALPPGLTGVVGGTLAEQSNAQAPTDPNAP